MGWHPLQHPQRRSNWTHGFFPICELHYLNFFSFLFGSTDLWANSFTWSISNLVKYSRACRSVSRFCSSFFNCWSLSSSARIRSSASRSNKTIWNKTLLAFNHLKSNHSVYKTCNQNASVKKRNKSVMVLYFTWNFSLLLDWLFGLFLVEGDLLLSLLGLDVGQTLLSERKTNTF